MFILSAAVGVVFGVMAIILYTTKLTVSVAGHAAESLSKHDKSSELVTKGLGVARTTTTRGLNVLAAACVLLSGLTLTMALVETLLAFTLVSTVFPTLPTAEFIISTCGDIQTSQSKTTTKAKTDDTQSSAASGTAGDLIKFATGYAGKTPYVWGGTDPVKGWDCSGFAQFVFRHYGIELPHQSESMKAVATKWGATDDQNNPKAGDLMWKSGHVAIYIGNGQLVEAANPRLGTRVTKVYKANWIYFNVLEHHG